MTKRPLLLRDGDDPLESLRPLVDRWESMAYRAIGPYVGDHRSPDRPLLLIGAAALDGYLIALDDVELIGDSELVDSATRAGLSDFRIDTAQAEELRGALTALRGAVGEQWVIDHLNSGSLASPSGATAAELMGFTNPGTDIAFTGNDGQLLAQANVKVASSAQVILEHFERHPDVQIVYASSDAAADAARRGLRVLQMGDPIEAHHPVVVDIGRSSTDFDNDIVDHLPAIRGLDDLASVADFLDAIPWFSMGAIAVRAFHRLQAGGQRADVLRESGRDALVSTAGAAASHVAASVTSSEPSVALIAVAASSLTYAATEVRRSWRDTAEGLRRAADLAEQIADRYDPPAPGGDRLSWHRRLQSTIADRYTRITSARTQGST